MNVNFVMKCLQLGAHGYLQGLNLSIKTVETHRSQIMHRLRIHDIARLVIFAIREGIIEVND